MEPALKQRLIGAAVLVALAVIFLPMLLNGPAPPPSPAANVPLDAPPAPGAPLQTREIPLTLPGQAPSTDPVAPAAPAIDDPNRVVTVDAADAPRIDARPEDAGIATAPASSPPPTTPDAPAAPPEPAPSTPAAVEPAPASTAATPPPAQPESPAAPATAPGGRYVVNLGSYGSAANASAVQAKLKQGGVTVYAENIDLEGKPVQRLRAGPFATRADAEAARLAVRRLQADLPASVVALDDAEPAPARAPTAVAGGYAVQVGAFKAENEANALRDKLRGGGFAAYSERAVTANGTLWRVRVGPELQRARADQLKASLQQRFQLDGNIVSHP